MAVSTDRLPIMFCLGLLAHGLAGMIGAGSCGGELSPRATHAVRPRFQAEVTAFVEAETTFAAVHVEIPYPELCFRKAPGGMESRFDIIVHVFAKEREVLADIWHESVRISSRRDLWGSVQRFHRNLLFRLAPGSYTFEVIVSEPSSGHAGTLRLGGNVPFRIPGRLSCSSLLIGECGLEGRLSELRGDPRVRNDFYRLDVPLCAYGEVYHAGIESLFVHIRWRLDSESVGELVASGEETLPSGPGLTRLGWQLPLAKQACDAYRVRADISIGSQEVHSRAAFRIQAGSDPPLSQFFRHSLDALRYIADEEELVPLRMASPDERPRAWDAFWKKRDPSPATELNESKVEFLRRLNYANAEFGAGLPGWRTDRGRIYIRYGEPEQIERYPYRLEGPPMEIWHYERLGRTFVFLDRHGFDNYELVTSE